MDNVPSSPTAELIEMFELKTGIADKMEIIPDDRIEPRQLRQRKARQEKDEEDEDRKDEADYSDDEEEEIVSQELEQIKEQMRKQAEEHARQKEEMRKQAEAQTRKLEKMEMMLAKLVAQSIESSIHNHREETREEPVSRERVSSTSSSDSDSSTGSIDSTTTTASTATTYSTATAATHLSAEYEKFEIEVYMPDGVTPRCQYETAKKTQCARNIPKNWWHDTEHPYCTFHANYDAKRGIVEETAEKRMYTIRQQQIDKSIEAATNQLKRQSAAVAKTNEIGEKIFKEVEKTRNEGKDPFNKLKERYSKTVSKKSRTSSTTSSVTATANR